MAIDLISLANARALGDWDVSDTADDALLSRYITSVSHQIEGELCRWTEATARTEEYWIDQGCKLILLDGQPYTTITSIKYSSDKDWASETALTQTEEWIGDPVEAVIRLLFETRLRPGYAQVVYSGGMAANTAAFEAAYPDIAEAAGLQALYMFNRHKSPGGNVVVAGGSTQFDQQLKLLAHVEEVISRHRRRKL
jgi:hypothetical protein